VRSVICDGDVIYHDGKYTKVDRDGVLRTLHEDLQRALSDAEVERRQLSKALLAHVRAFYANYFDPEQHVPFYRQIGSALLDRDRAAHRASKLDQEAAAGYSLSGRVLFGLRVDHFAEEGLETFETATDRAASVAPLHALSSGPIIPLACPE
jgi:hypothetical protein